MIDLSVWNITLPVQTPAQVVATKAMPTLKNKYFDNNGQRIVFWAPVTGSHTGKSEYPRSELRETSKDGKLRNWRYNSGTNTLKGTLAVNQVPSEGRVVVAQIHAKDAPTPLLKLVYRYAKGTGNIDVEYRVKPKDKKSPVIYTVPNVPLNKAFSYSLQMDKQGKLSVLIGNAGKQVKLDPSWYGYNFYFKAGVYTLDNKGYSNEGGKVTYTKLDVSHK
ncbi:MULTISPECIES: polysaccharide lyase family 7 protein [unclassified Pseudomonas]|uniref:polysaccharide lyase family 7 protein n=1 Tax=unclassified Pseudomonas TaxID=196821 RepID=UPI00087626E7|nr:MULTISPECIES: polysaccharide lyase family 7 protein [unclassified Pseudomonas]SCZ26586.1 Alginate lyase [Pseudomonas sp. NFACC44-2]SDA72648.1 Alginate lyase [Pseudomonas sp. NFACC51]SFH34662.1 Alginate lyase [Pseudomonas sp. NFACC54]SFS92513.1 Alginate lyase [Pseudomonas sp. NFACC48-1]